MDELLLGILSLVAIVLHQEKDGFNQGLLSLKLVSNKKALIRAFLVLRQYTIHGFIFIDELVFQSTNNMQSNYQ